MHGTKLLEKSEDKAYSPPDLWGRDGTVNQIKWLRKQMDDGKKESDNKMNDVFVLWP